MQLSCPPSLKPWITSNRLAVISRRTNSTGLTSLRPGRTISLCGILQGTSDPVFPVPYPVKERDVFYKSLSFDGWGGASGHDAPMIAYDALLGAGASWEELGSRAMFHGGDSDSTAVIAAAWWGALYGMDSVPVGNYKNLEYRKRIELAAAELFAKAQELP